MDENTARAVVRNVIERNSLPEPFTGCWLWQRGTSNGGYPVVRFQGKTYSASHLALLAVGIRVPKGMDACHTCDTPLCVNPAHLFVGTRKDNMQDAKAKGRLVGYGKRAFCKQGHPLSGDNVRVNAKTGKRSCKICSRRWGRITDARRSPRKRNPRRDL
jgi:hypothetical protein